MSTSNPFVIRSDAPPESGTGEGVAGGVEVPYRAGGGEAPEGHADGVEGGELGNDNGTVADSVDIEGLIPLCVQNGLPSHQTTATFGYDVAMLKERPWAAPGVNLADYFNYGFNEQTWRVYCRMQSEGRESLVQRAQEVLQELQLVATAPGDAGPSAPTAGGGYAAPMDGFNRPNNFFNQAGGAGGEGNFGGPPGQRMGGDRGGFMRHGGERGNFSNHSRYKTQICQRFMEGRCTLGASCNYAHGESELRLAPPAAGQGAVGGGGYYSGFRGEGGDRGPFRMKRYRDFDGGPPQQAQQPPPPPPPQQY